MAANAKYCHDDPDGHECRTNCRTSSGLISPPRPVRELGCGPACPRLWRGGAKLVKNRDFLALRRMRGQRKEQVPGDWFALQLDRDGTYRLGVIVKIGDHTPAARFPGGVLAYLFE